MNVRASLCMVECIAKVFATCAVLSVMPESPLRRALWAPTWLFGSWGWLTYLVLRSIPPCVVGIWHYPKTKTTDHWLNDDVALTEPNMHCWATNEDTFWTAGTVSEEILITLVCSTLCCSGNHGYNIQQARWGKACDGHAHPGSRSRAPPTWKLLARLLPASPNAGACPCVRSSVSTQLSFIYIYQYQYQYLYLFINIHMQGFWVVGKPVLKID